MLAEVRQRTILLGSASRNTMYAQPAYCTDDARGIMSSSNAKINVRSLRGGIFPGQDKPVISARLLL